MSEGHTPEGARTELVSAEAAVAATLAAIEAQARAYAREAKSANTRRAYASDWADFAAWCQAHGLTPLPAAPATVALYLTSAAERYKTSTLGRRLTAISQAHRAADHPSPT
jgi:site-specific recombinase XerD